MLKGTLYDVLNPFHEASCEGDSAAGIDQSYINLVEGGRLESVYKEVRRRAPFARIVVLGYPRFYVDGGAHNRFSDDYCGGVRITDQRWINSEIRRLNNAIRDKARGLGLQFVDIYDTPSGHELCGPSDQHFMNGIKLPREESYHPNAFGHELIADDVAAALQNFLYSNLFNVLPFETTQYSFNSTGGPLDVSTQWPGSDVVLTLTSPSGRTITRSTSASDVEHEVGPTFESYHIAAAEAGEWTASLYGAQVAAQGEQTSLDIWQAPTPNQDPKAQMSLATVGRTITVDGGASADADGTVVEYLWEFGDGSTATGSRVSHTYTTAGTYLTTLAIRDDQGGEAFTSADHIVDIPKYQFEGFLAPVDAAPVVNAMTAGRAVPMKFRLGGNFGLGIVSAGSPTSVRVDCTTGANVDEVETTTTAGASSLSYDQVTDTYSYVWKTASDWAGTCRTFHLKLDDGSIHEAQFSFRT
ncbi:PxKF domain-containing protein [Cryobacterium lyxosi]|uniref:PKD domain-containing protein n=1 Tax=Cryobacterium lyxosi TaxID=1259228 RepID=A0A4R8Z9Y2_9MICO|nr:PxKF domain-containing protein [Cryobacterium lyxosi]TFD23831.1 PKD domain-containing protein [Cryobacterium lyxosi]